MGTVTIRRVSERTDAIDGPTVSILHAAFGMAPQVPGPVWLLQPSAELRAAFWRHFGEHISKGALVSVLPGLVRGDELRDALGRPVEYEGPCRDAEVALFLADPLPGANWGHDCTWYLVSSDGCFDAIEQLWPPAHSEPLHRLRRPTAAH